jgi:hypothetical protein
MDSKIYDSTVTSNMVPSILNTGAGTGLVPGDTYSNLLQIFGNPNVTSASNPTMLLPSILISDGNNGNNYGVIANTASGIISQRSLTISAQPNTKTYDGTTSAAAIPIAPEALPMTTTGLVGSDSVTNLAETYDTPNAGTGKTLTVSLGFMVKDGNNGNNYSVTTATSMSGEIDTLYNSDGTLSDFTNPITTYATFLAYAPNAPNGPALGLESDMALPYTPTAGILATGDRVDPTGSDPIIVSFPSPVAGIRVFPNIDHAGSSFDYFQYSISGSNDGVNWTPLFDATGVNGSGATFTLGTFTGTEPNVVNNVLTDGVSVGVGPGGDVGYETDFVFSQAYTYYSFGPSTVAVNAGNADQELSGVAALPLP